MHKHFTSSFSNDCTYKKYSETEQINFSFGYAKCRQNKICDQLYIKSVCYATHKIKLITLNHQLRLCEHKQGLFCFLAHNYFLFCHYKSVVSG